LILRRNDPRNAPIRDKSGEIARLVSFEEPTCLAIVFPSGD